MRLTDRRDADLLERVLEGSVEPTGELRELVGTARALAAVGGTSGNVPSQRHRPDPDFVAVLRERLVAQAEARPVPVRPARTTTPGSSARVSSQSARSGRRDEPRVVLVPGRLSGALLAGVAALAVIAVTLGVASRGAVPGDRLYPVKQLIGAAQVRLAGDDRARGDALLRQADTRLDEVDTLVARGSADPAAVDESLSGARAAVAEGQQLLVSAWRGGDGAEPLVTMADFQSQAIGRTERLRPIIPTASVAQLDALQALLQAGQQAVRRQALVCGAPCADLLQSLPPAATTTPAPRRTAPAPAPTGSSGLPSVPGVPSLPLPTGVPRLPSAPSVPGVPGGGVTVPGGSVGVPLPGGGIGVPLPGGGVSTTSTSVSGGVSVPLPTVTVGSSTASLPGVDLTGTLPPLLP